MVLPRRETRTFRVSACAGSRSPFGSERRYPRPMPARFALSPSRIARFFYHECERNLRYLATPSARRSAEGVPPPPTDASPVTEAILEGGYTWEEDVVTTHLAGRVRIAASDGPLRDRYPECRSTVRERAAHPLGQADYRRTTSLPADFSSAAGAIRS